MTRDVPGRSIQPVTRAHLVADRVLAVVLWLVLALCVVSAVGKALDGDWDRVAQLASFATLTALVLDYRWRWHTARLLRLRRSGRSRGAE